MLVRAAFNLGTANKLTREELFRKNVKYRRLYLELLPLLEILNLLRLNPDIRSYILNNFKSCYKLAEFLEGIRDGVERMRYITVTNADEVIDALLVVKDTSTLKDIFARLTEESKPLVLEIITEASIK